MRWTPHATVAVVVERHGHFLVVEEQSGDLRVFNQPAGHLEENERFVDAAVRETLEETGWEVEITGLLGLYTYRSPHNGVTYHRTCFIARPLRHHPEQALDAGIVGAHWLSYPELQAREASLRSPLVLQCIEDYRKGQHFPLEFIQEFHLYA